MQLRNSRKALVALGLATATGLTVAPVATADAQPDQASTADTQESQLADYDLKPFVQVSGMKAKGFAGLVAIRATNVGAKRYYQEFPLTTFKVEVKTAEGPKGVDRVITPHSFHGAYAYDAGFDPETSTRTFIVTLSNPIDPGETKTIANLDFNDGLTKEGRLYNYITVTQIGRHSDDHSLANDQNVDSREHTVTDGGRPNAGIF